jgi:hypothetical protein
MVAGERAKGNERKSHTPGKRTTRMTAKDGLEPALSCPRPKLVGTQDGAADDLSPRRHPPRFTQRTAPCHFSVAGSSRVGCQGLGQLRSPRGVSPDV